MAIDLRWSGRLDPPNLADILLEIDRSAFISRVGHPIVARAAIVNPKAEKVLAYIKNSFCRIGVYILTLFCYF